MRVEVVAEQQRQLVVLGREQSRAAVVTEVALVDRLQSDRVPLVAKKGEDRFALGSRSCNGGPEWALARSARRNGIPEVRR